MIPTRYDIEVEDGVTPRMVVYKDGRFILYADAEKWVKEEVATLTDKLQEAQQNYDTAFGEWHRCIEQIAVLKEELESHAWGVSPAMAEAKIWLKKARELLK